MSKTLNRETLFNRLFDLGSPKSHWARFEPSLQTLESRDAPAVTNVLANNMAADTTSQDTQSETSLIVFGSTVLASYNDSGNYTASTSNHFTGWSRSTDGGTTFTDMGSLPGNEDFGDPVFARDNTTGRVYFTTLSTGNKIQIFRSDDGGVTFLPAVNAYPGLPGPTISLDKQWIAVDNFAGAGQGNVYMAAMDFGSTSGIKFTKSTDAGTTWTPNNTALATGTVQGAWITVGADHSVYLFYLNGAGGNSIRMRKSTDFGTTWSAATTVTTLVTTLSNGGLNIGTNRTNAFPQVVVNPVSGNLYMVYNDDVAGADRCNVFFTQSTNGGTTWSSPIVVNDDATTRDNWQPSLAITPDGSRLFVGFYDRRNDPANTLIEYFGANAAISGATVTFGRNYKISTASFGVVVGVDPVINTTYMGDYDSAGADNSFFYAVWGDNRDNSLGRAGKQANVRIAKIPVAGPAGPTVFSSTPTGNVTAAQSSVTVVFNQAMDQTSFNVAADVVSFTGPSGNLLPQITGFTWVNSTTLQIGFNSQGAGGTYSMVLGPQILATTAAPMDEDFNGTPGQTTDRYTATWTIPGARVTSSTPNGVSTPPAAQIDFVFDQNMDQTSFNVAADVVSFTGPSGSLLGAITGFTWVNATTLRVSFTSQSAVGAYAMVIGPNILTTFGSAMDQDVDGIVGEATDDRYSGSFVFAGPKVTSSSPTGIVIVPVSQLDFVFSTNMDQTSFSVANDVASFTGPNGNLLSQITGFSWVNATTLRVTFTAQTVTGTYALTIGPQILTTGGSAMDQNANGTIGEVPGDRYTATVTLDPCIDGDAFGYIAAAFTYDATLDLIPGGAGVVTIAGLSNGDLVADTIPLGTNTFNFYGTSYTGSSQLFLSPKGLITFGTSTTAFDNTDLTTSPTQAAIAVLWDDYVTNINGAPDDLVLYRFDDLNADTIPDRLVIEWNEVRRFTIGGTNGGTWQAILQLNTGATPGTIVANYRDLDVGSATYNNGLSSTVGIKNSGAQGTNRLLVSQNSATNPFVGTGKAVKFFINAAPSANAGGPYSVTAGSSIGLVGSGTDPDEPSANLRLQWDLDNDGIFGETGVNATRGDELGATPTFSSVGLTGPSSFNVTLHVVDCGNLVGTQTVGISILAAGDTVAPTVVGVYFDGTFDSDGAGSSDNVWAAAFRTAAGNSTYGYAAQTGSGQLTAMPWSTIDTVYVKFSENVTVTSGNIGIRGINLANYTISSFTYDNVNFVAKWVLSANIDTDWFIVDLDGLSAGAVKDLAGNKLAGTFTEGVSSFPTSGAAGVSFKYRAKVGVGDADRNGQTRNVDQNLARSLLFVDAGQAGYNLFADIDGNGQTRNADLNLVRSHLFIDPPTGGGPTRPVRGSRAFSATTNGLSSKTLAPTQDFNEESRSLRLARRLPIRPAVDLLDEVLAGFDF